MDRPKRVKFVPKRLRDNEKDAEETEQIVCSQFSNNSIRFQCSYCNSNYALKFDCLLCENSYAKVETL